MLNDFKQRLLKLAEQHPNKVALRSGDITCTYGELVDVAQQLPTEALLLLDEDNGISWVLNDIAQLWQQRVCVPVPPFFSQQQRQHLHQTVAQHTALPEGTVKVTFTSGSTGTPKGVCLSAANIVATVSALAERLGDVEVKRHMVIMPLAVLLENIAGVYLALWLGAEVVIPASTELGLMGSSSMDLPQFFSALTSYQPDSVIVTPELLKAIVAGVDNNVLQADAFKLIAVGGARLSANLERHAYQLKLPIVQGYGLSEFGSVVALNDPHQPVYGTVGKPLAHADVRLVDDEILVTGNCMLGYLGEPDSWFPKVISTGDYGRFDAAGNLQIQGRKKNTIITGYGRNIDPEWLEVLLQEFPEVQQAVVFGSESLPLTALIYLAEDAAKDCLTPIISMLNDTLPDYARIQRVFSLPVAFSIGNQQLTGTGRVRRENIRSDYHHLLTVSRNEVEHDIL